MKLEGGRKAETYFLAQTKIPDWLRWQLIVQSLSLIGAQVSYHGYAQPPFGFNDNSTHNNVNTGHGKYIKGK